VDDFRNRGDVGSIRRSKSPKSDVSGGFEERPPARRSGGKVNLRKALVRDQMIDKAAALFYSNGFAQTTINDIAGALELSRSSVYHYFKSKEEVLAALIEREAQSPYDAIMKLYADRRLTPTERLRQAVIQGIMRRLSGEPQFLVLSRLEAEGMPDYLAADYNSRKREILDLYSRMVADGIAAGEFRDIDPKLAAFAIIGMANWTSWWFLPGGRWTPQQIGAMIVDFALFGLTRRDHDDRPANDMSEAILALKRNLAALERLAGPPVQTGSKKPHRSNARRK
jgi:AcrR family transcriptional regulator